MILFSLFGGVGKIQAQSLGSDAAQNVSGNSNSSGLGSQTAQSVSGTPNSSQPASLGTQATQSASQPNAAPASTDSGGTLISGIASDAISMVFQVINIVISFIGGILFEIAAALVNLAVLLNFNILGANANPIISMGWGITRDLANLGFVLFIIVIAIATILRMQEYGAKSTLAKLIAVALLVNFSLVFAGVFIDFSNMLTNFFIKNATGGDLSVNLTTASNLGFTLAKSFKIQDLAQVKNGDVVGIAGKISGAALQGIASSFFVAAFTFIGAISLLALAAMFFIRYVAMSMLLILVPLACLFWILPSTKNLWNKWWDEFIKWIIFGPTASFFLYFAIYMATNYATTMQNLVNAAQGTGTANQMNFSNLLMSNPLFQIGNMIIIIGFLLGGLMVANESGVHGSKAVMGWAQSAVKWGQGGLAKGGLGVAGRAVNNEAVKGLTKGLARSKFAPFRWAGAGLNNLGGATENAAKKQYAAEAKSMSDERLEIATLASRGDQQAAYLANLADRKGGISDNVRKQLLSNPETMDRLEAGQKRMGLNFKKVTKGIGYDSSYLRAKSDADKKEALDNFWDANISTEDASKIDPSMLIDSKHGKLITEQITKRAPGAFAKLLPKIKGIDKTTKRKNIDIATEQIRETIKNIEKDATTELDKMIHEIDGSLDIGKNGLMNIEEKLKWIRQKDSRKYNRVKHWQDFDFEKTKKSINKGLGQRFYESHEEKEEGKKEE